MSTRRQAISVAIAAVALSVAASDVHAGRIHRRQDRQQGRIAGGAATGKLSPQEASRLEAQEGAIKREEQAMRDANGGHLTAGERRVINHQQNRVSRRIYRQKHDGNDR